MDSSLLSQELGVEGPKGIYNIYYVVCNLVEAGFDLVVKLLELGLGYLLSLLEGRYSSYPG